jgi:hypothetical protein
MVFLTQNFGTFVLFWFFINSIIAGKLLLRIVLNAIKVGQVLKCQREGTPFMWGLTKND